MTRSSSSRAIGALIVGDEILSGRRQDRHMQQAINILAERGLELSWVQYLGDDELRLAEAFGRIADAGDICFSFGGIGATPDDRTRQAMARAHKVALVRHPDAVQEIEQRYGEQAYPKRILMAELPEGSAIIPNAFNRIPGFSLGHIHCMPGFPEMAWPMLEWLLDNRYPELRTDMREQLSLFIDGVRESELIEHMERLQATHPEVSVSSLPRFLSGGGYRVEMGIRGVSPQATAAFENLQRLLDEQGIAYRMDE